MKNILLNRTCINILIKTTNKFYSTNNEIKKRICIVGAGPAGFYSAQYIVKHLPNSYVDIVEKLPVPFGLVRFGVAPDHPEVKNVINTFTKTAQNPRVRFFGNLSLGENITLKELREKYHAVLLTYGASIDRFLNIPNETERNVLSAREFVAWYNGLPGFENLNPILDGESVSIVGQGNVAIDVSRILLSPIDLLKKTDITAHALEALSRSSIKEVCIIGRRGPLQAAYTIKELREMLKLPNCKTIWRESDFDGISEHLENLQRPRKRLTELMLKSYNEQNNISNTNKLFRPIFFRSPKSISENGDTLELGITKLLDNKAVETDQIEIIKNDMILRSIGYKSICVDEDLNFDEKNGYIHNVLGRVIKKQLTGSDHTIDDIEDKFENGLYTAGWLSTGPTGVILTTMNNAFSIAENICQDIEKNKLKVNEIKPGLNINKKRIVTWDRWNRIDTAEIEAGAKNNKPREKILNIETMLKVAGL